MQKYKVVWDKRLSISINAKNEEEAIELVERGEYDSEKVVQISAIYTLKGGK